MNKILILFILLPFYCFGQTITTYVGNGTLSYGIIGDGGLATNAPIGLPGGVSIDNNGNLIVSMYNSVRKINHLTNIISTIAGCDTTVATHDGSPATCANVDPKSTTVDRFGNYYIADYNHFAIRKVDAITGIINDYAGNESWGYSGDSSLATAAQISWPIITCIDTTRGILYFPDEENYVIRKVDMTTGIITTFAGTGVNGYFGDGGPATAAQFSRLIGACLDHAGNLYIGDYDNGRIRKINIGTGIITSIIGNGTVGFAGDGVPATNAEINFPAGLCFDNCGNLLFSDLYNNRVRKYDTTTGIVTTIVGTGAAGYFGDGGSATAAKLYQPYGVTVDAEDNLYIADFQNNVVRKVNMICHTTETNNSIINTEELSLYPNPITTNLSISNNGSIINSVSIYNLVGQLLYNNEYNNTKVELYVGDLAKGVYIIRVNGYIIQKFIKE